MPTLFITENSCEEINLAHGKYFPIDVNAFDR